jgi:hypothetical protein
VTDRIDRSLMLLWAVLGAGVFLKPSGYVGWADLALWGAVGWVAVMVGLCYLRTNGRRMSDGASF